MFLPATTRHLLGKKRCSVEDAIFEKLDLQQQLKDAPVSGPVPQEKVLQVFKILYPDRDAESFEAYSQREMQNHSRLPHRERSRIIHD